MATQPAVEHSPAQRIHAPRMAAHAWRGLCLSFFARAEEAVSRAVCALSDGSAAQGKCHLVGPRYEELKRLLALQSDSGKALRAVQAFDALHRLRRLLCHGTIDVGGKCSRSWRAELTMPIFKKGKMGQDIEAVDVEQAAAKFRELQSATERLVNLLDAVISKRATSN